MDKHEVKLMALYGAVLAIPLVVGGADLLGRFASAFGPEEAGGLEVTSGGTSAHETGVRPLVPSRIEIPKLEVDAQVVALGVTASGAMDDPASIYDAGWYRDGIRPGALGTAVLAGHLNNGMGLSGVFKHLEDLEKGDRIRLHDASGRALEFRVTKETVYDADAGLGSVMENSGRAQIALITCEGKWNSARGSYEERLVVYAELAE